MTLFKQAKSPNWNYDVRVDGRRLRGSCKTTNVAYAKAIEAEIVLKARRMGPEAIRPRKPVTLAEVAERFFTLIDASQLAKATKTDYGSGWKLLQATNLPKMQVRAIKADDITIATQGILTPYSANSALRTLRRMLNKAREWDYISTVPLVKLRKAPGRSGVYDANAEAALLAGAAQPLRDVLLILLDTGARPFEVMAMRWEDVNFSARTIFISKSKTPKGIRHVPMSERVMDALLVRCAGKREGWIFPSPKAKSGHAQIPQKAFREARERAGIDSRLVIYTCRHSFATYAMAQTRNAFAVGKAMGHANMASMATYQHPELDAIREVIDRRNASAVRPS